MGVHTEDTDAKSDEELRLVRDLPILPWKLEA